ncbi:putative U box domain, armadillo-like helical, Zinc finger, RING/FYVE/PHD-type [Dioscorea sansibarensis]
MGRKIEGLEVKVPSYFRCPISLEVMRSPVSLCTGVTYDRTSIQRWLDSGNTTCPATMLPLPSTDLVPNLTLRRLISLWSLPEDRSKTSPTDLASAGRLPELIAFLSDPDRDEFDKNSLAASPSFSPAISSLLGSDANDDAVRILALVLNADFIEDGTKRALISALAADLNRSTTGLLETMRRSEPEMRVDAARVLDAILTSGLCNKDSRSRVADNADLLRELIRLIGPAEDGSIDRGSAEAGLSCLLALSSVKRARARMVEEGLVPALARALTERSSTVPAPAAEKALKLMEAASSCAEGRAAICAGAAEAVVAVVNRMMKAGKEGAESAVIVLWTLCHLYRDRKAQEAVAGANGVLQKILLLMQGDCSPAMRQMSGDLLRIFRVNSKSCLSGYDTKTTHIMPF